jgi:hypothetical protein
MHAYAEGRWCKKSPCLLPAPRIHTSVRTCESTQKWCGVVGRNNGG